MGVTGDSGKLKELITQLRTAANGRLVYELNANLGEEALDLVQQGFEHEEDPYGNPWAPLKHRQGKILTDTARLRRSFARKSFGANGFTVGTNVAYAAPHQSGAPKKNLPQRRMLPDGPLPEAWRERFEDVADEIVTDHFSKS